MVRPSARGMGLSQLIRAAKEIHLAARPISVTLEHLAKVKAPAVLHWNFNHFVVLLSCGSAGIEIHDPAVGRRTIKLAEALKSYTGVALELSPATGFSPRDAAPPVSIRQTIGRLRGFKRALLAVLTIAAGVELTVVILPFYLQWVLDRAVLGHDTQLLTILGIAFLAIVAINATLSCLRGFAITSMGAELNFQWTTNTFAHLLRLPLDFFERRTLGSISSRFDSISVIQKALTAGLAETIIDGLFVVGTLVMMLLYSVTFALISVGAVAVYVAVRIATHGPLRMASQEVVLHAAKQRTSFIETVRGIQTLRLFNKEAERSVVWSNLLVDQFNADLRAQRATSRAKAVHTFLFNSERVVVVWVAAYALIDGEFTVGVLVAYLAYREQFVSRCFSLIDRVVEWRLLQVHAERMGDVVLASPEEAKASEIDVARLEPSLELRGVSFSYGRTERTVLQDFTAHIRPGECVAIVGPSGCGKSTLAKIILGLLAPTSGAVLIGGVDACRMSPGDRRDLFGTVMQEDSFFAGSIYENISFFDSAPDLERVHECASLCGIAEDIERMPMRYQTLLGDAGNALSGGQRQRLLLARALYKQPRILLLDEATSHLDVDNERRVGEAIGRLRMTRIVIAHRPETIAMCDRVIAIC
jgi:ATP-binding cassette, subfamily B, bacterial CvaB/MchF/RaxB